MFSLISLFFDAARLVRNKDSSVKIGLDRHLLGQARLLALLSMPQCVVGKGNKQVVEVRRERESTESVLIQS